MKTIVVMSGGGMNGAHHGGVLRALLQRQINIDAVVGVSAGALFAAGISQAPPEWPAQSTALDIVQNVWFSIKKISDVRKGGTIRAVWRAIRQKPSLYTFEPTAKLVNSYIQRTPLTPCRVGVVSLQTGMYSSVSGKVLALATFREAVLASSSIPGICPPAFDEGVDGGVIHVSPLGDAFELAKQEGWTQVRILLSNCWSRPGPDAYSRIEDADWNKKNVLQILKRAYDIQSGYLVSVDLARTQEINRQCLDFDSRGLLRPARLKGMIAAEVLEVAGEWGYDTWTVDRELIQERWRRGLKMAEDALLTAGWDRE